MTNDKNKNKNKKQLFLVISSITIIAILIFSAPANAFSLNVKLDDTEVVKGDDVNIEVSIDTNNGENLDIKKLELVLNGPEAVHCFFDEDGNKLSDCKGIIIKKIVTPISPYGYGYSYGYGFFQGNIKYNIKIDTSDYITGEYETKINFYEKDKIYYRQGDSLLIKDSNIRIKGSSDTGGYCETDWKCTSWSPCIGGVQKRFCQVSNEGCLPIINRPQELKTCSIPDNEKDDKQVVNDKIDTEAAKFVRFFGGPIGVGIFVLIIFMSGLLGLCIGSLITGSRVKRKRFR
ncbi:MAG: hypothetical protein Q8N99_03080 [Nanoarchaeota archaeon]|nr:hypothetical protein [Nanoarchaeota archaeon]